jgi:CRISPR/Cas system-associated protein Cas10 (large subunit of type III CRISPR-Cas system)
MKIVTEEMKNLMIKLYNDGLGLSQAQIGREFGISECTVGYWLLSENKREKRKEVALQKLMEYYEKRQLQKDRCCPHCKKTLPIIEFTKTKTYCKECNREYGRAYNKTYKRSTQLKKADKIRRKIWKNEVATILGGKCSMCGLELTNENLCVFDLHHKNLADKERTDIDCRNAEMLKKILDGKIMLFCSNCHRMFHHKNGDSLYTTPKKILTKTTLPTF